METTRRRRELPEIKAPNYNAEPGARVRRSPMPLQMAGTLSNVPLGAATSVVQTGFVLTVDDQPIVLSGDKSDALTRYDEAVLQTAKLPRVAVHTITLVDASGKLLRLAHFPPCEEVLLCAQANEDRVALHRASAKG